LSRGDGHCTGIDWDGRNLFVSHVSLGHRAAPMKRAALVVALPAAPVQVYVAATAAE
jgi:hypothetical protein